jgi:hypothetical protein
MGAQTVDTQTMVVQMMDAQTMGTKTMDAQMMGAPKIKGSEIGVLSTPYLLIVLHDVMACG